MKRLLPARAIRVAAALAVAAGLCVVVGSTPSSVARAADGPTLTLTPSSAPPKLVGGQYVVEFTATYKYPAGRSCNGFTTNVVWPLPATTIAMPAIANFPLCTTSVAVVIHTGTPGSYRVTAGVSTNPGFATEQAQAQFVVLAIPPSPSPSLPPTAKPSSTATAKPSATVTATAKPSATPTLKPSPTATVRPTIAPTEPPVEPTAEETPSPTPTEAPTTAAPQTPPASPAAGTPKPAASSEPDAESTSNRQPSSPLPILIVSPIVIGGLGWLIFVAVRRLENS